VITIASCSPKEESYEIPELQQGSFTYSLLEALRIQGENNCATVERLCNRLRERIPEINRQHNKPPQTLHSIVEPHYKNHLILLPKQAKTPDIELLRVEALELEVEGKLEEARQLMRRVLALDTTRPKYWQHYDRINRKLAQQPVPPSPKTEQKEIELKSAKGIDYTKLRDLLKQQKWQEADEETANVMLQAANRTEDRWLREEDIDNFPCEDLRTIDQLWVKYSGGRFGFSVQAKIYRELGGTRQYNERVWNAFADRVGWRVNKSWIYYKDVTFDIKAPHGHLPIIGWWIKAPHTMTGWLRWGFSFGVEGVWLCLLSRVETCKM
jgi:molybdopterin converting factor small subunit